jgi:MFS family permease
MLYTYIKRIWQFEFQLHEIYFAGGPLGTAIQLIVSGFIAQYWGWPAIFYVNGTLGVVWTLIYIFIGSATPKTSRIISEQEKLYIETSLGQIGHQKVSLFIIHTYLCFIPEVLAEAYQIFIRNAHIFQKYFRFDETAL